MAEPLKGARMASGDGAPTPLQLRNSAFQNAATHPDRPRSAASGHTARSSRSLRSWPSLPLETALERLQHPDGPKETRTLLPGIRLRWYVGGDGVGVESSSDSEDEHEGSEGDHLPVVQTPKGVSLKDAIHAVEQIPPLEGAESVSRCRPSIGSLRGEESSMVRESTQGTGAERAVADGATVSATPSPWPPRGSSRAQKAASRSFSRVEGRNLSEPRSQPPSLRSSLESLQQQHSSSSAWMQLISSLSNATFKEPTDAATTPAPTAQLADHEQQQQQQQQQQERKQEEPRSSTLSERSWLQHESQRVPSPMVAGLPHPDILRSSRNATPETAAANIMKHSSAADDASPQPRATYAALRVALSTETTPNATLTEVPCSPAAILSPAAPHGLSMEARAEAAGKLWPTLAAFTPRMLRDDLLEPPGPRRRFVKSIATPTNEQSLQPLQYVDGGASQPNACNIVAACALADVSGFTSLTASLSREGPSGVELLTRCMNSYFAQVIDLVLLRGGDVVKFAGDALLIVFPPSQSEAAEGGDDGGLKLATLRAAACMLELTERFGVMRIQASGEAMPVPRGELTWQDGRFVHRTPSFEHPPSLQRHVPSMRFDVGSVASSGSSALLQVGSGAAQVLATPLRLAARPLYRHVRSASDDAIIADNTRPQGPLGAFLSPFKRRRGGATREREEAWLEWSGEREGEGQQDEQHGSDHSKSSVTESIHLRQRSSPAVTYRPSRLRSGGVGVDVHEGYGSHIDLRQLEEGGGDDNDDGSKVEDGGQDEQDRRVQLDALRQPDAIARGEDASRADRIRAIHERTLANIAARFTGAGKSVRPPELPSGEDIAEDIVPMDKRGIPSSFGEATARSPSSFTFTRHTTTAVPSESAVSLSEPSAASLTTDTGLPDASAGRVARSDPGDEADRSSSVRSLTQMLSEPSRSFETTSRAHNRLTSFSSTTSRKSPRRLWPRVVAASANAMSMIVPEASASVMPAAVEAIGGSNDRHDQNGSASLSALGPLRTNAATAYSCPCSPQHSPPHSPRQHYGVRHLPRLRRRSRQTSASVEQHDKVPIGPQGDSPSEYLSLKVTLAAGTICAYRVGGVEEQHAVEGAPKSARWEFFVADAQEQSVKRKRNTEQEGEGERFPSDSLQRGPFSQFAAMEATAVPAEVVVSPEAMALLGGSASLRTLEHGGGVLEKVGYSFDEADATLPSNPKYEGRPGEDRLRYERRRLMALPASARLDAYLNLRSHVPPIVRRRLEAGHIDSVNEVRVCTVIFFGFLSLGASCNSQHADAEMLSAVQMAARATQARMEHDGGFFLQMRCDEKGYVALCAFGLPGRAHEDSPARGISAALAVIDALQRAGQRTVAGVATGNLFCAVVGSHRRAEYTVFGDAINVAARLMVTAKARIVAAETNQGEREREGTALPSPQLQQRQLQQRQQQGEHSNRESIEGTSWRSPAVICDQATRWLAGGRSAFAFAPLAPFIVKGKVGVLQAYACTALDASTEAAKPDMSPMLPTLLPLPLSRTANPAGTASEDKHRLPTTLAPTLYAGDSSNRSRDSPKAFATAPAVPLIGRDRELATVGAKLASLVDGRGGGSVFVEGEAGVGKTRLAEEVAWGEGLATLRQRCQVLVGVGRAVRSSEPLYPWRRIFRQAFAADRERSAARWARPFSSPASKTGEQESPDGSRPAGKRSVRQAGSHKPSEQAAPTDLEVRLHDRVPGYAMWRSTLATALGLPEEELPAAVKSSTETLVGHPTTTATASPLLDSRITPAMPSPGDVFPASSHEEGPPTRTMLRAHTTASLRPPSSSSSSSSSASRPSSSAELTTTIVEPSSRLRKKFVSARMTDPGRPPSPLLVSSSANTATTALPPAEMSITLRAEKIRDLLVSLLVEFSACHGPLLIVMDDMHLFDTPSWRLTLAMLAAMPHSLLFLGTLRPILLPGLRLQKDGAGSAAGAATSATQGPSSSPFTSLSREGPGSPTALVQTLSVPPAPLFSSPGSPTGGRSAASKQEALLRRLGGYYEAARWMEGSERISLRRFNEEETQSYISAALGGISIDASISHPFWEKSAGLPAYVQQIVAYLQLHAAGALSKAEQRRQHASHEGEVLEDQLDGDAIVYGGLEFVRATVNVHAMVPARVDRLRPDEQLTLKLASVMGAMVREDLLAAVHPRHPESGKLSEQMASLEAAGFMKRDPGGAAGAWRFADVLDRDVVYDMIPATQRRDWHAHLAEVLERGGVLHGGVRAAIVAYHWTQACVLAEVPEWRRTVRAALSWERAATDAALGEAYEECSSLLDNAVSLAMSLDGAMEGPAIGAIAPWRRARWERCCAAASLAAEEEQRGGGTAVVPGDAGVERLEEALARCLRALDVVGVAMPWEDAYKSHFHGWRRWLPSPTRMFRSITRGMGTSRLRREKKEKNIGDGCKRTLSIEVGRPESYAGLIVALARLGLGDKDGSEAVEAAHAALLLSSMVLGFALPRMQERKSLAKYARWACGVVAKRLERGSTWQRERLGEMREMLDGAFDLKGSFGSESRSEAMFERLKATVVARRRRVQVSRA